MQLPPDPILAELVRSALVRRVGTDAERPDAIYLFGSLVRGADRPDSDADLAILGRRGMDPTAVFDAAQDLASELRRDVDLVDLRRANTVLATQVVSRGRRIEVHDRASADRFEAETLAEYAYLGERRRAAVDRFLEPYVDSSHAARRRATWSDEGS